MPTYTFLINPKSSSGNGERIWKFLEPELKKRNVDYEAFITGEDTAGTVAKITADEKEHTLVVLGGDGTLNQVVNGISRPEKIILGFIPTGSGNDFSKLLKLPTGPKEALENILHPGRLAETDIGICSYNETTRRFLISCGINFDADVCHQVEKSRFKTFLNGLNAGNLIYAFVAARVIFQTDCVPSEITVDGETVKFKKTFFAAAMNQPYEGGGFKFCPEAKTDDGMIDLIVVEKMSILKVMVIFPFAMYGKHTKVKGIHIFRCRKADIRMEKTLPIHTDGEPVAFTNTLSAEILPEKIRVIAPAGE